MPACLRANLPLQGNILDEKVLDAWLDDASQMNTKACQQRIFFIIFFVRFLLEFGFCWSSFHHFSSFFQNFIS